jgi:hypothetical protein
MLPGFIMWLLGVPLAVIILLHVFHVVQPACAALGRVSRAAVRPMRRLSP